MIEIVRDHSRNVKRWQPGDMRLRWAAAGMLEAEKQLRRVKGYRQLPTLTPRPPPSRQRRPIQHRRQSLIVRFSPRPPPKFYGQRDILSDRIWRQKARNVVRYLLVFTGPYSWPLFA